MLCQNSEGGIRLLVAAAPKKEQCVSSWWHWNLAMEHAHQSSSSLQPSVHCLMRPPQFVAAWRARQRLHLWLQKRERPAPVANPILYILKRPLLLSWNRCWPAAVQARRNGIGIERRFPFPGCCRQPSRERRRSLQRPVTPGHLVRPVQDEAPCDTRFQEQNLISNSITKKRN